jgi:4-alpha-glucanotransferase
MEENILAAFATHDLPTFAGWPQGSDLAIKAALAINPGESLDERDRARQALHRALSERKMPALEFIAIARYLAESPSRLVLICHRGCGEQQGTGQRTRHGRSISELAHAPSNRP